MGEHVIKMPDVGEGVAEAELVEWMVEIGANVREDEVLASVMTDKATVEIPSPVEGKVLWQGGAIGDDGTPSVRGLKLKKLNAMRRYRLMRTELLGSDLLSVWRA